MGNGRRQRPSEQRETIREVTGTQTIDEKKNDNGEKNAKCIRKNITKLHG